MFNWYKQAKVCYAFLLDMEWSSKAKDRIFAFEHSRWFIRGWMLQELLAPTYLVFLDRSWNEIGTKENFKKEILKANNIGENHLFGNIQNVCITTKISWAVRRETTRPEDMAYCLLGNFWSEYANTVRRGSKSVHALAKNLLADILNESIFS